MKPHTERLCTLLEQGAVGGGELQRALSKSQPVFSRTINALQREDRVLKFGVTRNATYALRAHVPGAGSRWPIYRIDQLGEISDVGTLHALHRDQYYVEAASDYSALGGLTDGLPYFLQGARPAGFLGRAIPAAFPDLDLPRLRDWRDADYLKFLTQRGSDVPGDLILGAALDHYFNSAPWLPSTPAAERESAYAALAERAMQGALPGASAEGEQPKFTVNLATPEALSAVLVKFSGSRSTDTGRRWSDLLVAEHVATAVLAEHAIRAARTDVLLYADRTYLEVQRFDRVSHRGRRGVTSLRALDVMRHGEHGSWTRAAARLHDESVITPQDFRTIALLDAFGDMIANSDRHLGNLSFHDDYDGKFSLAPVYDMLPMVFAPLADQLVVRTFDPPNPSAATLDVWDDARRLAQVYWTRLAAESRLSPDFRAISAECLSKIEGLPRVRTLGVTDSHTQSVRPPT